MNPNSPLLGSSPEEEFKSFALSLDKSTNPLSFNGLNRPTSFFGQNSPKAVNQLRISDNGNEKLPSITENNQFFKSMDGNNEKTSINQRDTRDFEENHELQPKTQIKTGTFHLSLQRIAVIKLVLLLTVGLFPLFSLFTHEDKELYICDSFFLDKQSYFSVISGFFLVLLLLLFRIDKVKNDSFSSESTTLLVEQLPGFSEQLAGQLRMLIEELGWKVQSVTLIFDEGDGESGERRGSMNKNNLSRLKVNNYRKIA